MDNIETIIYIHTLRNIILNSIIIIIMIKLMIKVLYTRKENLQIKMILYKN